MVDAIVTINHGWPARQFIPGGSANRYIDSRMAIAVGLAKRFAPSRTGELRSKIKKTGTLNQGPLRAVSSMYCDAPHAWYVHDGTMDSVIAPKGKKLMPIPRAPKGFPYRVTGPIRGGFVFKHRVRGQRSQPFLSQGADIAFADIL